MLPKAQTQFLVSVTKKQKQICLVIWSKLYKSSDMAVEKSKMLTPA